MADPICRWRNTSPETVKLLVGLLPKTEMPEGGFKEELKRNCEAKQFDYNKFIATAYQLAVQIGLYYVDSAGTYHPRFNHDLTDAEASEYVSRVSSLYVSPNPYTKSMSGTASVSCLYDLFVQYAGKLPQGASIDVRKALEDFYQLPIGNTDMVVNLMVSSGAFNKIDNQHIVYKGFEDIATDKERFFNHFGVLCSQGGTDEYEDISAALERQDKKEFLSDTLQLITYGAPGTGKSFKIKNETTGQKVFRTTFHPDSDYATFVGAYKPVMKEVERTVFVGKKLEMADVGSVKDELKKESVISYEFVEQVFTKAYIEAWGCQKAAKADEEPTRVYLVIEEINRGNCAQIFGDLFQLLDRNGKGFSEYPIRPDSDFGKHIATALGKKEGTFDEGRKARINALYPEVEEGVDIVDEVLSGRYLLLPDNLFIRATMNTSDQSLFPMDSAFKRRWDWDYVPIEDHPEENWEIEIDSSTHYKWWDFLNAINKEIFKATSSEDKKLGYFFVQAKGGKIDLDTFVNKVVFYLWNSVFKDCYTDCGLMKKDDEKDSYFIFTSFFKSGKPDAEQAKAFLGKLKGVKSVEAKEDETAKAEAKAQTDGTGASDDDGQSVDNG